MLNLRKSLALRISLPIVLPILGFGAVLYSLFLTTVSDFALNQINNDLAAMARRSYNICDINFNMLLLSGLADDKNALIINQGLTLGQIEDFFAQENIYGFVYDSKKNEILYQTYTPVSPQYLLSKEYLLNESIRVKINKDSYFAYLNHFQPWEWKVIVLKDEKLYSDLMSKVRIVHLATLSSLFIIACVIVFFIYRSVNGPTQSIVKKIQEEEKPDYKGVDVFEFLSDTIAGMMDSIRQNEEKYRMLVENSNQLIWEIDLDMRFTLVSQTTKNILGYNPDEIIGKQPFYLMKADEGRDMERIYKNLMDNKLPFNELVNIFIHKNGTPIYIETTAVPFYDENNNISGYRGIYKDISDRVAAENEKIDAQQMAAEHSKQALVGQVAGKMAHDFNNILSIIMGHSEIASFKSQEEDTKKTLKLIYDQTLRGKNLTKNLVAFAKDQEPNQIFFSITDKIKLVLDLMKKDLNDINIETSFEDNIPDILADPGMIEHALVNLVQNSIHALSLIEKPEIKILTFTKDNNINIEITDNGCGIPEQHIEDIFIPSFTLKGSKDKHGCYKRGIKGTGYGMSNIKKYINQHQGDIAVESQLNKYTQITISLPIITQNLSAKDQQLIDSRFMFSHKKILLVEDEEAISYIQKSILSQAPCFHNVDLADEGLEAIKLFDKNNYDIISLDYVLQGSINGLDIYKHIRKSNKQIPVLFVSGNIEFLASIKELKEKDPYIDHLSKPCRNSDYINRINALLNKIS